MGEIGGSRIYIYAGARRRGRWAGRDVGCKTDEKTKGFEGIEFWSQILTKQRWFEASKKSFIFIGPPKKNQHFPKMMFFVYIYTRNRGREPEKDGLETEINPKSFRGSPKWKEAAETSRQGWIRIRILPYKNNGFWMFSSLWVLTRWAGPSRNVVKQTVQGASLLVAVAKWCARGKSGNLEYIYIYIHLFIYIYIYYTHTHKTLFFDNVDFSLEVLQKSMIFYCVL